jgi:hypothetical protein
MTRAAVLLVASSAITAQTIYRKDALGNETPAFKQDSDGRYIIRDDRIYKTDPYGNIKYHEPVHRIGD